MNWIDKAIATIAPVSALKRAAARRALASYDAAKPSRMRKLARDKQSGDMLIWRTAPVLRDQARDLERNHDLARGILNVLVNKTVGPNGIGIEPLIRLKNGDLADDFIQELLALWRDWCKFPEVTGQMNRAQMEQMAARTAFRDGELFSQTLEGAVPYLDHGTKVPFSLELLEPDLCPYEFFDISQNIFQGIQRNAWGRPTNYFFYKQFPGDKFYFPTINQVKTVSADRVLHLAMRDRITQLRGVSQFASVITRLDDIKDYEESERVAAKVAASMAAFIKKGTPDLYGQYAAGQPGVAETDEPSPRNMRFAAGMIFDDLLPGEEIGTIDSKRPNQALEPFRQGQLRAVAAGTYTGHSSISKSYDGNYSAQRQELVEQQDSYATLSGWIVSRFSGPTWERFCALAVASRQIRVPPNLELETLSDALYSGPPMPWIDPLKETLGQRMQVRCGFKTVTEVLRERGKNLHDTFATLARERRRAKADALVLESDAGQVSDVGKANPTENTGTPNDPAAETPPADAKLNGNRHHGGMQ